MDAYSSGGRPAPPSWLFVTLLLLSAFALRLVLVLLLTEISLGPVGGEDNDDVQFDYFARSLLNGDGYRDAKGNLTSFRAPGFPFFLVGLYTLFGVDYALGHVVFCILGAANSVLAYFLAREFLKESHARAVGILCAVYLGNLTVSLAFISETLFIPLLTLGCWLFVRFLKHDNLITLGCAGLVLGYATLTRPFSLLLLPFWGLLLCWTLRLDFRRLLIAGLVYTVPFLLPILPWTYRNYQVHGHLVLMTTNGGSTFFGANNDRVFSERRLWGYWIGTNELPERPLIDAAPTEYEHDQVEWRLGKEWIRDNPGKAVLLGFLKIASLWIRPPEFTIGDDTVYLLRGVLYYPLLILMVVGLLRCLGARALWRPEWAALHLVLAATLVTAVIFCGLARFRDANVSLLMIYALLGWDWLATRWRVTASARQSRWRAANSSALSSP